MCNIFYLIGHENKFIQILFSTLILFSSTKQNSFSSIYFFIHQPNTHERKLNFFHSLIFPSPQPNEPLKSYKEELKSHVVFWQLAQTLGGILASKPKINRIP